MAIKEKTMHFLEKSRHISAKNHSFLCVGLDSDWTRIPQSVHGDSIAEKVYNFNMEIIEATKDLVGAYKPNSAFYEALGAEGVACLQKTIEAIPPEIPVILDVKRGDIGNTAKKYAEYCYNYLKVDAVTLNPLMGSDAITPFLAYEGKMNFVLALTSNPSANEFIVGLTESIVNKALEWNEQGSCGLVVGATRPDGMRKVRQQAGDLFFLIPGIGAQGGDIQATVEAAKFSSDFPAFTINSSRGIIFADNSRSFAEHARKKAKETRDAINQYC